MPTILNSCRWVVRVGFLLALILGIVLWTGHGYEYLRLHMWIGFIVTFALLALVIAGSLARISPALPIVTFLWAIALPAIGIAQLRIVPGPNHWIIRVIHLILGLGAIGLAEVLTKKILLRQRSI